jgi:hypothetical protein
MSDHERDELPNDAPLLTEAEEHELAAALRAAYAPSELEPARHAEILALLLEDPFAEPSDDELRESERLRQALESDDVSHPDAALARALKAATRPEPLSPRDAQRLVPTAAPRRPNVVYVTFGAVALAAAASFALFLLPQPRAKESALSASAVARPGLLRSRSTQDLFHERFEPGEASARIDRIASAREHDWRENQYALWGVR